MSHQLLQSKDFVGKTIKRIDARAVNITTFFFTDGTAIAIEVDALGPGIYGMVQCAECAKPARKQSGSRPRDGGKGKESDPWSTERDKREQMKPAG